METDIGHDYESPAPISAPEPTHIPESVPLPFQETEQVYPPMMYTHEQPTKKGIFDDIDKTTYLILFISFILGFFMGKTMQPVILRSV